MKKTTHTVKKRGVLFGCKHAFMFIISSDFTLAEISKERRAEKKTKMLQGKSKDRLETKQKSPSEIAYLID